MVWEDLAKAYKMKYEAMKHQGKKLGKNTLDKVGEAAGENAKARILMLL